jgi:aminoglycoside phosphotransferase (APT) family kinase protein
MLELTIHAARRGEAVTGAGTTGGHCDLLAFLRRAGLVAADETPCFSPLTGGIASDIWKVETARGPLAIKRALPQLRVPQEWKVPVSRNASEVEWMRTAGEIVPNAVPRVLAHDPALGAFAMEFLDPARFPVWKTELAAGRIDACFAAQVGATLAAIHGATAHRPDMARTFANDAVFHSIRLEPYLETAARAHRAVTPQLMALSRQTLATRLALVHGDVSPKNILVGPHGPVLLDAECAWFGDPAFDLAFCLNHLLLKCIWVPAARERLLDAYDALGAAYLERVTWEPPPQMERRTAVLLAGLMLARIDGKSPVEYITAEADKSLVRGLALDLISSGVSRLPELRERWRRGIAP